jgi:hypothetical protein
MYGASMYITPIKVKPALKKTYPSKDGKAKDNEKITTDKKKK